MTKINMRTYKWDSTINTKISNFPLWKKNYQQIDELNGQARQTILCNKTHVKISNWKNLVLSNMQIERYHVIYFNTFVMAIINFNIKN